MLSRRAAASAVVAVLLAVATVEPAVAGHFSVLPVVEAGIKATLACPSSVEAGARPRLDLRVENTACEARSVRILSTVVGNGDQTVGGVGILGPVVVAASVSVPAATDLMPATCIQFQCEGTFYTCSADSDCECRTVEAGVANVDLVVPTPLPVDFDGTVVNQFIFTDKMDGSKTLTDTCLIRVPEPRGAFGLLVALASLTVLKRTTPLRSRGRNKWLS